MRVGALIWRVFAAFGALLVLKPVCGQPTDWQAGIARIITRKDLERAPGTAFVVEVRNGNAYLVTSAHVVEGDPAPQVEFVAEPEKIFPASVRGIEPEERGLALLVVSNAPGGIHAIPESSQPVTIGASVAIAGFPAALNRFSLVDMTVASTGGRDLFLSRETDEGFSGGPVLVGGSVVGIVYGREGGFGKALGASSIKPFIEGSNLTWGATAATPRPQADDTQVPAPTRSQSDPTPRDAVGIPLTLNTTARELLRNTQGKFPGETRENPKDGLTYVWIPPGKFTMGCSPGDSECNDTEKPPHEVTITRGFWMGRTEVTVGAYGSLRKVPEGNGSAILPKVSVTWDEAKGFCESAGMRLPTEAEWEYAARAGTTGPRYGVLDQIAWHRGNESGGLQPVGRKQPNAWGLYDMFGNAYEWVADWDGAYQAGAVTDPDGPSSGQYRVLRGGGYGNDPIAFRASFRWSAGPSQPSTDVGFRCAGDLPLAGGARTAVPAGAQMQPATPTAAPPGNIPGQTRENPKDSLTYVWIPPGKFTMGCSPGDSECSDSEKPAHEVTITRGFWMGQTEVTVGAYERFRKAPAGNDAARSNLPVVHVTWNDAKAYCESAGLRLPTEAEWEYAARANTTGARYAMLDAVAWHRGNSGGTPHPVGEKEPNAWGLYDMLGNAYEWVADWYGDTYQQSAGVDPTGPSTGTERVIRGGGWVDESRNARASFRYAWGEKEPDNYGSQGFRCAGELPLASGARTAVPGGAQTQPATPTAAPPGNIPGQTRENPKDSLTYVWIPPGKFTMGCSPVDSKCLENEKPTHEVTITRGFWMGRTEVTVGAYGRFRKLLDGNGIPILPVVNVTWAEAKAYCERAGLRLPTEAEWEYAARAATAGPQYAMLDAIAWHSGNNGGSLKPVGKKEPNEWGLYDMLGNAAEWVADWHGNYQELRSVDPTGPQSGEDRMWRGGTFKFPPEAVRVSERSWDKPTFHNNGLGFRCAGDLR